MARGDIKLFDILVQKSFILIKDFFYYNPNIVGKYIIILVQYLMCLEVLTPSLIRV